MRNFGLLIKTTIVLLILFPGLYLAAQSQAAAPQDGSAMLAVTSQEQQKVFVFVQRTDHHVKRSSPEVFHDVLSDLLDYLQAKKVAIAVDEFGGRNHAESSTPLDTIFAIARDAKATSVMYVVVDRPLTKWIKITVRCFDMNRKRLWQEEVSSGGGLSGGHGLEVSRKKLHKLLDKRVGREGLPVLVVPAAKSAAEDR